MECPATGLSTWTSCYMRKIHSYMVSPWQEAFCYGGQSRSVTHFTGHLQPQTSRMKLLTLPSSPHLSQPHRGQHRLYGLQTRTPHSFAFPAACSVGQPCLPGQGAACSSTAVPPEGPLSLLWSVSVASEGGGSPPSALLSTVCSPPSVKGLL